MESDIKDLRSKSLLVNDKEGHDFIKYQELLNLVKPKN